MALGPGPRRGTRPAGGRRFRERRGRQGRRRRRGRRGHRGRRCRRAAGRPLPGTNRPPVRLGLPQPARGRCPQRDRRGLPAPGRRGPVRRRLPTAGFSAIRRPPRPFLLGQGWEGATRGAWVPPAWGRFVRGGKGWRRRIPAGPVPVGSRPPEEPPLSLRRRRRQRPRRIHRLRRPQRPRRVHRLRRPLWPRWIHRRQRPLRYRRAPRLQGARPACRLRQPPCPDPFRRR